MHTPGKILEDGVPSCTSPPPGLMPIDSGADLLEVGGIHKVK